MPLTTNFGGSFPITWYKGRKIHLLGGTPLKQKHYASLLDVVSVDCNSFVKVGDRAWKTFHAQKPHWRLHAELNQKQLFELSCQEILKYWDIPIKKQAQLFL